MLFDFLELFLVDDIGRKFLGLELKFLVPLAELQIARITKIYLGRGVIRDLQVDFIGN